MSNNTTNWQENATTTSLAPPDSGGPTFVFNFTCSFDTYLGLNALSVYGYDVLVILVLVFLPIPINNGQAMSGLRSRILYCLQRGCIYPLNMLDGYEHRLSYACVFGTMTVQLVDLLLRDNSLSGVFDFDDYVSLPLSPALSVVAVTISVAVATFASYPLFLCITAEHKFAASILGLVGAALRLCAKLWTVIVCKNSRPTRFVLEKFKPLFYNMPSIVFLSILCGIFVLRLVQCIRRREFGYCPKEQNLAEPHHIQHVTRLLGSVPLPWHEERLPQLSIFRLQKFKSVFYYKWTPYFRFPTRLVATFTIMAAAVYQIGLVVIFKVYAYFKDFQASIRAEAKLEINLFSNYNLTSFLPQLALYFGYAANLWIVVTCMTFIMAVIYLYHTGICYRKHIYRLYAGDRRFFPTSYARLGNPNVMTNAVRYAGLQIAFFMWGFVLIQSTIFVFLFVIVFVIFVPMIDFGYFGIVVHLAEAVIAPIVINMIIYYVQVIMTRCIFLQPKINPSDDSIPLAVDNRRVFYNVSFFFFFWNIFLGIVSAIMRVLKGMLLGIFLIPRIDRSVMMRGYESMDNGFMCYLGLLSVINAHDHPVVKVFLKILKDGADHRRAAVVSPGGEILQMKSATRKSRQARHNWLLAYTLLHNPEMIVYRKTHVKHADELDCIDSTTQHRIALAVRRKRQGNRTSEFFSQVTKLSHEAALSDSTERLNNTV